MIYRGPGFPVVVRFVSSPACLPLRHKLFLFPSLPVCHRWSLLADGAGEGWGTSQITRRLESVVLYKSFSTLWRRGLSYTTILIMQIVHAIKGKKNLVIYKSFSTLWRRVLLYTTILFMQIVHAIKGKRNSASPHSLNPFRWTKRFI